jgi:hypothetical protein
MDLGFNRFCYRTIFSGLFELNGKFPLPKQQSTRAGQSPPICCSYRQRRTLNANCAVWLWSFRNPDNLRPSTILKYRYSLPYQNNRLEEMPTRRELQSK